jgi:cytochrome c
LAVACLLGAAIVVGCATGAETGSQPASGAHSGAPTRTEIGLAQADLGKTLYAENCSSCHGDHGEGGVTTRGKVPPVVGPTALPFYPPPGARYRKQQFGTARDLYDFVKATMPPGMGGTLADQDYLDIVAFALMANGVDLSRRAITLDALAGLAVRGRR